MGIVFFEDFSQDTKESIVNRYPGTSPRQTTYGTDIDGWPLQKAVATTSFAPLPPNSSNRTELYLEFDDNAYGPRTTLVTCFYGIVIYAPNASSINFYAAIATGATVSTQVTVAYTARDVRSMYVDVNLGTKTLTVLINNFPILINHSVPANWEAWYTPARSSAAYCYNTNGSPYLSNSLTKIVIATDTPVDKILDYADLQFQARPLVYVSSLGLNYSTTGFVEDVDKNTPMLYEPNLSTETTGSVTYSTVKPTVDYLGSKIYPGSYSENPGRALTMGNAVASMPRNPGANPIFHYEEGEFQISIEEEPPFVAEFVITSVPQTVSPRFTTPTNISVDWGDGETTSGGTLGRLDHTYALPGTYQMKIKGQCSRLVIAHSTLTRIVDWGNLGFDGFQFYKAFTTGDPELTSPNLVEVPAYLPRGISDLLNCFYKCSTFNQNLSLWCVSWVLTAPVNFDALCTSWVLPRPVWGTCPSGV